MFFFLIYFVSVTSITNSTCKAALPYLKETQGAIINVSATLQYAGTLLQAHACAAKAGVDALTKVLALEWGTTFKCRSCN